MIKICQSRIQKIQKWVAWIINSSILDTFYFSEVEFYKSNTKFQRKRGRRGPLGPSLNRPMYANSKISGSLLSRCLEVVGERENGCVRGVRRLNFR